MLNNPVQEVTWQFIHHIKLITQLGLLVLLALRNTPGCESAFQALSQSILTRHALPRRITWEGGEADRENEDDLVWTHSNIFEGIGCLL